MRWLDIMALGSLAAGELPVTSVAFVSRDVGFRLSLALQRARWNSDYGDARRDVFNNDSPGSNDGIVVDRPLWQHSGADSNEHA